MFHRVPIQRTIATTLVAPTLISCSKAVEIPRDDIDDPKYRDAGSYRIRLQGWEEYLAARFSVTDSTIVIEELLPSDERFRTGRENLPITIVRERVASVSHMETNWWVTVPVVTGFGLVAGLFILLIMDPPNLS